MEFIIVRAVWDGLPAHSTDDRDIMGTTIRTSDNLAVLRSCVMTTMITEHRIEIYTLIEAHFHTAFNDSLQTRKVCRIVNANVLNHCCSGWVVGSSPRVYLQTLCPILLLGSDYITNQQTVGFAPFPFTWRYSTRFKEFILLNSMSFDSR